MESRGVKRAQQLAAELDAAIGPIEIREDEKLLLGRHLFDRALGIMVAERGPTATAHYLAGRSIDLGRQGSRIDEAVRSAAGAAPASEQTHVATWQAFQVAVHTLKRVGMSFTAIRSAMMRFAAAWACRAHGENVAMAELEAVMLDLPRIARTLSSGQQEGLH